MPGRACAPGHAPGGAKHQGETSHAYAFFQFHRRDAGSRLRPAAGFAWAQAGRPAPRYPSEPQPPWTPDAPPEAPSLGEAAKDVAGPDWRNVPAPADEQAALARERAFEQPAPATAPGRQLLHGQDLIGMSVWDPNRQRLGVIKDFIIQPEAQGPNIYFAMAPEVAGWTGGYAIVPFDAFRVGYDDWQPGTYFVMGLTAGQLLRAPHLAIDRWGSIRDRQFFSNTQQFYRQNEHSLAGPEPGPGREYAPRNQRPRPSLGQPA